MRRRRITATAPFMISRDLAGIAQGRNTLFLLNKQKRELHRDTNARLTILLANRGFWGQWIDGPKRRAKTHLLFDNRNYRAVHGYD
jgi:hypothetical protein